MVYNISKYEISDWIKNESKISSIVWYRSVKVKTEVITFGLLFDSLEEGQQRVDKFLTRLCNLRVFL